jgi:hypothetical protein
MLLAPFSDLLGFFSDGVAPFWREGLVMEPRMEVRDGRRKGSSGDPALASIADLSNKALKSFERGGL